MACVKMALNLLSGRVMYYKFDFCMSYYNAYCKQRTLNEEKLQVETMLQLGIKVKHFQEYMNTMKDPT